MHRSIMALTLLLMTPLVSAQIYKWKDASGTVHYSQTPPPNSGTRFQQIKPDTAAPPTPSAGSAAPTTAPATAPASTTRLADTPENRASLCVSLQANLTALLGQAPVVMQQDGRQTVLDDSARKQQVSAAQAQYRQYCAK